jgi:anti-sigma regulatory factor (Ser/Thr protein kinase)
VTDIRFASALDGEAMTMSIRRRRFCGGAGAPMHARRAVRETLGGALSRRALGDVELLVSELATNSVRHAGCGEQDELGIEAAVDDDRVRVRLCDGGYGFEAGAPEKPDVAQAGGFGLVLLDRLADAWGVQRGERFCVWFELARS